MCATAFSGRSDARYCSPACRQKAHRDRTARRLTEWAQRAGRGSRTGPDQLVAAEIGRTAVRARHAARQNMQRSRELSRASAEHVQRAATLRRQAVEVRLAATPADGTR